VQQYQIEVIGADFLQKPPHHDIGVRPLHIGDAAGAVKTG
jgi:hypothetical protein